MTQQAGCEGSSAGGVEPPAMASGPRTACCLAVIEKYRSLWGGDTEGAALFCKECGSRLVHHEGVWGTEGV